MRRTVPGLLALLVTFSVVLVETAPATAGFGSPHPVTPAGADALHLDQATDGQGDTAYLWYGEGAFHLRVRTSGGRLLRPHAVTSPQDPYSVTRVAVDGDGDGVVLWDQIPLDPGNTAYLYARRFDRRGRLGPVVRVAPASDWVQDAQVGLWDDGRAVVTWTRARHGGYQPFARTIGRNGHRGPVLRLGPGPDASDAAHVSMAPDGRALLLWTNGDVVGRYLSGHGDLSRLRTVRRAAYPAEPMVLREVATDRRGVTLASCEDRSRNTATPPYDNSYDRACLLRISPRLRLIGKRIWVSRRRQVVDGNVRVAVAPDGTGVVGWQRNYVAGAWVRRVGPSGGLGPRTKISTGGIGEIALGAHGDGIVTSTGVARDGHFKIIRVTRVRRGVPGRSSRVGMSDYDTQYLRAALLPSGRRLVSWGEELTPIRVMAVTGR